MGRKKKVIEEVKFEPSHYQKAIYDFVQHDVGHLVVSAKAPELCPVCAHPQAYFEVRQENY